MKPAIRLSVAGLWRRPGRTALRIGVITVAVGLLAGMILFIGNSLRTASATALRGVPLDLQGPVASYPKDLQVAAGVAKQPGVAYSAAAATAPFASAERNAGGLSTQTSSGAVLAVPRDYAAHVHTFRMLQGGLRPGAVVLDQQMAATLQARIGDTIRLRARPNAPPQSYPVSGVALITSPDVLFQPLNPLLGPAPAQPPQNGAIMLTPTFAKTLAPQLPEISTGATGASAQPGAQTGTQWQVQAQLDRAPLAAGSPSSALSKATHTVNRIQSNLPGQVQFVNNLSDSLNTAAGDALYAETLFLLLAVPGALIALGVAYLAALGTSESDRRDLALLRARGARPRDLLFVAGVESLLIGLIAGLAGVALGLAAVQLLVSGGVQLTIWRGVAVALAAVGLSIVGSAAARLASTRQVLATEVSEGRTAVAANRVPAWRRYYLDLVALALSGLIYWLTIRTGFSAGDQSGLEPDAVPLGLHVLRPGAALDRGHAPARQTARPVHERAGSPGRAEAGEPWLARRRQPGPASLGGQPGAGGDRTAPGLRSQPRDLHRHLQPAGQGRCAAHPGRRRHGHLAPGGGGLQRPAGEGGIGSGRDGHRAGEPLLRVRGAGPPGHLRNRPVPLPGRDQPARLLLHRRLGRPDDEPACLDPRRHPGLEGDDHRLLAEPGIPAPAAGSRPGNRPVPGRALPRDRHRPGVPLGPTGLVHGHEPRLPQPAHPLESERGLCEDERKSAGGGDPSGGATRALGTEVKNIDQQTAQTVTSITTVDLTGISHLEEVFAIVLVAAATADLRPGRGGRAPP